MRLRPVLLAATATCLAGCAAYQAATSIQNNLQTFLVRAITLNNNGQEQASTVLIWGGTNALNGITKQIASGSANPFPVNTSSQTATDSVNGGVTYTYTATFAKGDPLVRTITPFSVNDAGQVSVVAPNTSTANLATGNLGTASGPKPTLQWSATGTPSGFMVTVGEATVSQNFDPTSIKPLYTAFLDAATHSTSVTYGTPSDMPGLTSELTTLLGGFDKRFAKNDSNVPPLVSGKTYAWLISPIVVDAKATKFGIGNQSFGLFKDQ